MAQEMDPNILAKLQAAQKARQDERRTSSVQYKAVERAAQQSGMDVDEYAKKQGTSVDGLIRDMKRGGGGATSGYAMDQPAEPPKKTFKERLGLGGKKPPAEETEKQKVPTQAAKEPEPKYEPPKANYPVRDMDKVLLDQMTFTLANNTSHTKVALVIGFKEGTTPEQMIAAQSALRSKLWTASQADDRDHKGYDAQFRPREGKTPQLIIGDNGKIASLIKEMVDAGEQGRISKRADFVSNPDFEGALELHEVKARKGALGGGPAKG